MPRGMKTVSPDVRSLNYYVRVKIMMRLKPKTPYINLRRLVSTESEPG